MSHWHRTESAVRFYSAVLGMLLCFLAALAFHWLTLGGFAP